MGLTSGVDTVEASSGCAGELEPQWRTRMLTLIFVFKCDFCRCGNDLGPNLGGFGRLNGRKHRFLGGFFENVDFVKIVVFPQENCYF